MQMRVARSDQHQQVIEDVSAFGDEVRLVLGERRDDRFDRLFAEFLADTRRSAGQQLGGVGLVGIGGLARFDFGEERVQRMDGGGQVRASLSGDSRNYSASRQKGSVLRNRTRWPCASLHAASARWAAQPARKASASCGPFPAAATATEGAMAASLNAPSAS